MIQFFRKIRRQLIDSNVYRRYLIYAIGEIILVVIGILIALQLNSWNEQRKLNHKQEQYLGQLKAELLRALNENKQLALGYSDKSMHATEVLKIFWDKESLHDSVIKSLMIPLKKAVQVKFSQGTAMSLVNSGDLEIINSSLLRIGISPYLNSVNNAALESNRLRNQLDQISLEMYELVNPRMLVLQYWDYKKIKKESMLFIKNQGYPNLFFVDQLPYDSNDVPFTKSLEDIFAEKRIYDGYYQLGNIYRVLGNLHSRLHLKTEDLIRHIQAIEDGNSEVLWNNTPEEIERAAIIFKNSDGQKQIDSILEVQRDSINKYLDSINF